MDRVEFITMDGASFNVAHVLSFKTPKSFVKAYEGDVYKRLELLDRRKLLEDIYLIAKSKQK